MSSRLSKNAVILGGSARVALLELELLPYNHSPNFESGTLHIAAMINSARFGGNFVLRKHKVGKNEPGLT